jgi:hypothetical protein
MKGLIVLTIQCSPFRAQQANTTFTAFSYLYHPPGRKRRRRRHLPRLRERVHLREGSAPHNPDQQQIQCNLIYRSPLISHLKDQTYSSAACSRRGHIVDDIRRRCRRRTRLQRSVRIIFTSSTSLRNTSTKEAGSSVQSCHSSARSSCTRRCGSCCSQQGNSHRAPSTPTPINGNR